MARPIADRGAHTGTARGGLGAREATGGETYLDVLSVEFDGAGALVGVEVHTDALTGCPDFATVQVAGPSGELARQDVALDSDFPFFGLVSIETPCRGRANIRVPGAGVGTRLTFKVLFSGEVYAEGRTYRLGDLAESPPDPPPEESDLPENPVDAAVSGVVEPVLWGTASLGAAYLAFDNIDTISGLIGGSNDE